MNKTSRYVVAVVVFGSLAGCANSQARDRAAEIAAAKCFLPVAEQIHPADTLQVQTSNTEVKSLGDGRFEVTGTATVVGGAASTYTCDVVPDPADKLRGLRVTKLRVQPSN